MIKIDKNIIPPSANDYIENIIKNKKYYTDNNITQPFPFFYQESMTYKETLRKEDNYQDVGFSHAPYVESQGLYNFDYGPLILNILYRVCSYYNILITRIFECRAFLQPPSKTSYNQEIHIDIPSVPPPPFYSLIYYVSDSDGDTVFFSKDKKTEIKRVTPEKGKTVLFNGHIPHRGIKPVNKTKLLLNYTFQGSLYNQLT